jgi:membrane protease YdiL (CAAX protease family)
MNLAIAAALPDLRRPALLLLGLAGAVTLRVAASGSSVAGALVGGATFGVVLIGVVVAAGGARSVRPRAAPVALGVGGAIVLVGVPLLIHPLQPVGLRTEPFAAWAMVTVIVATAEEALLRGVMFDALARVGGLALAVPLSAAVFALMHVPLYGWSVVPLDLGAGLLLGALRIAGRGVAAPAIAHVLADLASWWL